MRKEIKYIDSIRDTQVLKKIIHTVTCKNTNPQGKKRIHIEELTKLVSDASVRTRTLETLGEVLLFFGLLNVPS